MSVASCIDCGVFIDTDFNVEVFREEFGEEVLCDECYESRLNTLEESTHSHREDEE